MPSRTSNLPSFWGDPGRNRSAYVRAKDLGSKGARGLRFKNPATRIARWWISRNYMPYVLRSMLNLAGISGRQAQDWQADGRSPDGDIAH
jgi:hypothetical protein